MLFISLTTLTVYSIKMVHEIYWRSSSITCEEEKRNWILRIFTSNDKNPLNFCIISTLQFFWESQWTRRNPISLKTIWHIPNIENSQFKLKKCQVFPNPLLFFISFFRQYLTKILRPIILTPPPPIINVVCKYLRQFLGTSFGVATLPTCCNIK